jgi:molybdenum cofactor biosynthesis protein A
MRCFYCMPLEGVPLRPKAEFMSNEEVVEMARIFVSMGVTKIRLTGGEPLVRHGVEGIIERLAELPIRLAITTNGVLLDRFIDVFRSSGVTEMNVSLDSLRADRIDQITRRNHAMKVLSNIDLLMANGFRPKANMVVMRGVNDDEVTDFMEWTRDVSVDVRFIEFMPFDGNRWDWSKGVSQAEILARADERFGAEGYSRIADRPNDTSRNYRLNGAVGTFAIISSVTNPFCDTCNRLRITADGRIKNCLFSGTETDLLTAMRYGVDIKPLIISSVMEKKQWRGGRNTLETLAENATMQQGRSMVVIGG